MMRRLCVILILLFMVPNCHQCRKARMDTRGSASFEGKELRCAIALGSGLRNNLRFGLNYELLHGFADAHRCTVSVKAVHDSLSLCDSLMAGVYDLAVLKKDDTLSVEGICKQRYPGCDFIWATRDEGNALSYACWLAYAGNEDPELLMMTRRFSSPFNPLSCAAAGIRSREISPYDELIRKYAKEIGWDWKMLAALIYSESKFTINNISPRGAIGLMQVMPLDRHGDPESLMDPETNIRSGVELIAGIQRKYLSSPTIDPLEREKLVLASYNAGAGRIAECRRIAAAHGKNPDIWDDVKSSFAHHPEFKGDETVRYVDYVLSLYGAFQQICTYR